MNGRLIVIEGTDSVGKETQTRMLAERLSADGHNVLTIGFPDYESHTGKLVKHYLSGDFGPALDIPGELSGALYALDRAKYKTLIIEHLAAGGIVVLDRYVASNIAFQSSKRTFSKVNLHHYQIFFEALEYEDMGMPRPDLTVFLDGHPQDLMPVLKARQEQAEEKGAGKRDQHEASLALLSNAHSAYKQMAQSDATWVVVNVLQGGHGDRTMRPAENVHADIMRAVTQA